MYFDKRCINFLTVAHDMRCLRSEIEQRANRVPSATPGTKFKHLA